MDHSSFAQGDSSPEYPPAPSPAPPSGVVRPVAERERIVALDVLRGIAIFGIFVVNIHLMSRPFMDFVSLGDDAGAGDVALWALVKVLFEFKFVTLFSLLFGMGMAVQLGRADAAGRGFAWLYGRRLLVLAGFGLVHGLVFWYGDILFLYACFGGLLLAMARLTARTLCIAAIILVVVTGVLVTGMQAATVAYAKYTAAQEKISLVEDSAPADEAPEATIDEAPAQAAPAENGPSPDPTDAVGTEPAEDDGETLSNIEAFQERPFRTVFEVFASADSMFSDEWREIEVHAYRDGPFGLAFAVRAPTWVLLNVVNSIFSWGWRLLGIFLLGAALMKVGFFDDRHAAWHRRMVVIGLLVGLPIEIAAAAIARSASMGDSWSWVAGDFLHYVGSLPLCAAYVGGIVLMTRQAWFRLPARALAAVGRMALTNYLGQTLIGTAVMYWWGLGLFDTFERPQQLALVVAVFAVQIVLSLLWLTTFRIGPLEWLWRTLTYLSPPPLLRRK